MKVKITVFYFAAAILGAFGLLFDRNISLFIAGYRTDILTAIMNVISYKTWIVAFGVFLGFLLFYDKKKRKWVIPFAISMAISMASTYALKFIVNRTRPETALSSTLRIDSSFPSAHAASAFAILPFLYLFYKEFKTLNWIWIVFSLLMLFSRIYLGMHYLTDIVTGAVIGFTVSLLVIRIKK